MQHMIKWKLKEFLEEHNLTAYRLAQQTTKKVSQNAVYNAANGDISRIDFNTLDGIIVGLSELTNEEVVVSDLIERVPDLEQAA